MVAKQPEKPEEKPLTSKQYDKLADWGERAALVGLASLVVQQIVAGVPILHPSVLLGAVATGLAYYAAYRLLKRAT